MKESQNINSDVIHNNTLKKQPKLVNLSRTGILLALILAFQTVGLPNLITGILVNSILIFSVLYVDIRHTVTLALLSPIGAMISNHLPAPLYPMLPVIICGNLIFVVSYFKFRESTMCFRLLLPSFLKAILIWIAGKGIISYFELSENMKWLVIPIIGIQFFTAVGGIFIGEHLAASMNSRQTSIKPD